jgi:hypothetical protein
MACAGVHGRLIDLVSPTNKKYVVAICAAMGRHMHSVVVDTGDACKDCMRFLTEHQKPRMTFLALDRLVVAEPSDAIKSMMGTVVCGCGCLCAGVCLSVCACVCARCGSGGPGKARGRCGVITRPRAWCMRTLGVPPRAQVPSLPGLHHV